jgi:uncharacterized membrane protein YdfJ with MMPL/SSD domain
MDLSNDEQNLRHALLSPSSSSSPVASSSPQQHRSFNETSFSFGKFWLGRTHPLPTASPNNSRRRVVLQRRSIVLPRTMNNFSSDEEDDDDDGDDAAAAVASRRASAGGADHTYCDAYYWIDAISDAIYNYRLLILTVICLILWPVGFHSFVCFQRETDSTFRSIPGSPSALAEHAFAAAYSSPDDFFMDPANSPLVVVLEASSAAPNSSSSLLHNHTQAYAQAHNFSIGLVTALEQHCWSWSKTGTSPKNDTNSSNATIRGMRPSDKDDEDFVSRRHRGGSTPCLENDPWLRISSYYSLIDQGLGFLARSTLQAGSESVLVQVEYSLANITNNHEKKERVLELMYAIDGYRNDFFHRLLEQENQQHPGSNDTRPPPTPQYFSVHYTGLKYFSSDLVLSTRRDMMRMDFFVLPLVLLLMGCVLQDSNPAAVWMVPVLTMVTTVSLWSMLMHHVVLHVMPQISTFTPTVMMSLSLGMGIDYTLFLLSRYLEEMKTKRNRRRAVRCMLLGSGHVLVLSGLTLAATFGGLCLLPLSLLQSIGVGAAISILSALLVNLVMVPALLFTPLGLWIRNDVPQAMSQDVTSSAILVTDDVTEYYSNRATERLLGQPRQGSTALWSRELSSFPRCSIWFRMSKHLLHPYKGIIILLVTVQIIFPVALKAWQVKSSISFDLLLPALSPSLQTYHRLGEELGRGSLNPYRILFDGRAVNVSMTSAAGFEVMRVVLDQLRAIDESNEFWSARVDCKDHRDLVDSASDAEVAHLSERVLDPKNGCAAELDLQSNRAGAATGQRRKGANYNGISVLDNNRIPYPVFVSAKYCSQLDPCPLELFHTLNVIDHRATSSDGYATVMTATLDINPFSKEGIQWLQWARRDLDHLKANDALSGVSVYLDGSAGIAHDAVAAVYESFPMMVVITSAIIFVLMGFFFKSIFPPVRSVVSISLTLAFSFGLAVLVFQDHMLSWTHFRAFIATGDELCWLVPVMAFSIIVGLALDYDIFLISRILEYRLEGYEHKTSIALGLESTGSIITAAGGIMAVSFGSLLFGSNPALCQWSFLLVTAVLLDTFVIRTVFVPILTGLAGSHCWWPRELPEERMLFSELDHRRQESVDDIAGLLRTLESSSEYEPLRTPR